MTFEETKAPSETAISEQGMKGTQEAPSIQFNTKMINLAIYHLGIIEGLLIDHPNSSDITYHTMRLFHYITEVV